MMNTKSLWLGLLALTATIGFSGCENESDDATASMGYRVSYIMYPSGFSVVSDMATQTKVLDKLVEMGAIESHNFVGIKVKSFIKENVVAADTARVMAELGQEAATFYTQKVEEVNHTDFSVLLDSTEVTSCRLSYQVVSLNSGSTYSFSVDISNSTVYETNWVANHDECPVQAITWGENNTATLTLVDQTTVTSASVTNSTVLGIIDTEGVRYAFNNVGDRLQMYYIRKPDESRVNYLEKNYFFTATPLK